MNILIVLKRCDSEKSSAKFPIGRVSTSTLTVVFHWLNSMHTVLATLLPKKPLPLQPQRTPLRVLPLTTSPAVPIFKRNIEFVVSNNPNIGIPKSPKEGLLP